MIDDLYPSFAALQAKEREGEDFRIVAQNSGAWIVVLAPHGGGIEPGTSELAAAIAGVRHGHYAFEGIKAGGNKPLHITSTRFREPRCEAILRDARRVVAIHGEKSASEAVFLGGTDCAFAARVTASLAAAGFVVDRDGRPDLAGTEPNNLCNRGATRAGVQLEIPAGLRQKFFADLEKRKGRETKTPLFYRFVRAIQAALLDYDEIRRVIDPHEQARVNSCTQSAVEMVLKLYGILGSKDDPVQKRMGWDTKGFEPYTALKTDFFGGAAIDYVEEKFDVNLCKDWRAEAWARGLELLAEGLFPIYSFAVPAGFHCFLGIPDAADRMQWITKPQVGPGPAEIQGRGSHVWLNQAKTEILVVRPR